MKYINKISKLIFFLLFFNLIFLRSIPIIEANNTENTFKKVYGTIVGVILTETLSGNQYLIIQLDDGNKYRLKSNHGLLFRAGSDVELEVLYGKGRHENDKLISVNSIMITAISYPGTNKKVKYPPSNPPEIIEQPAEILEKIEAFKEEHRKKKN